jgi:hypothetical protein
MNESSLSFLNYLFILSFLLDPSISIYILKEKREGERERGRERERERDLSVYSSICTLSLSK